MALKVQSSFSSGELDPVLHERTTFDKYKNGLATARNVVVSKTAGLMSRPGRSNLKKTKNDDEVVVGYSPPGSGILLEFGPLYVRLIEISDGTEIDELVHAFTEDDLPNLHFDTSGKYVYIACEGKDMAKLLYDDPTPAFVASADIFETPAAPSAGSVTVGGTGYAVDYLVTYVQNGQESDPKELSSALYLRPVDVAQKNTVDATLAANTETGITEARVYRRPRQGGAYGLIGVTSYISNSGGNWHGIFEDIGQEADYSKSPPTLITTAYASPLTLQPKTCLVYQQRLLLTEADDTEALYASRPGFQNNFYRDYPFDSDSALKFKAGTSGKASVLRMIESDGLIVFTSIGPFTNVGPLSVSNIALEKKGRWVIDEDIPPLAVPGGVFFIDKSTNTLRHLLWSQDLATYTGPELSVFSNHLFADRSVTSWAFQEGSLPVMYVTFDDGDYAIFTHEFEQEMRAWTRCDSQVFVEQVIGTGLPDTTMFLVRVGDKRYWEKTIPRTIPASLFEDDPDVDKSNYIAFLDSVVSWRSWLNESLAGADVFELTPVTPDDWEGTLTLTCGTSAIFTSPGPGAVDEVLRFFDDNGESIDLTVMARTSNNSITVQPDREFPLAYASGLRLYRTATTLSGLDHMEGEDVSVIVDGFVASSPLNDLENYPTCTVTAGSITLPNGLRGAMIHAGRPICADIQTLDIDTVEQQPTLVESLTVNKVYVKVHESRGLYVGNRFPEEDLLAGDGQKIQAMTNVDKVGIDYEAPDELMENRYKRPETKRVELSLSGDWRTQGKICLRQVDGIHFGVLSIIPDVEVQWRSDRR